MSNHTPAPWKLLPKQKHQNFLEVVHTDTKKVGAASEVIARVTHRITWSSEQESNARLIAAAPDLLEALEKLARLGNGDQYGNSEGNMIARAAIAKATGEQL